MKFILLSHSQVVGVMGQAIQAVSPSLISSILRCAQKTDIPLSNQKAALQAFRLMDVNDEVQLPSPTCTHRHTQTHICYTLSF